MQTASSKPNRIWWKLIANMALMGVMPTHTQALPHSDTKSGDTEDASTQARVTQANAVQQALWLRGSSLDLTNADFVTALTHSPVKRIIVPLFMEGQTYFAAASNFFPRKTPVGKGDALGSFVEAAHKNNIEVYGYLDCFHWAKLSQPKDSVLAAHPELAEQASVTALKPVGIYGYASPFHPQVQSHLLALATDISQQYPDLDGFVLNCQLPNAPLFAFNEEARAIYIRSHAIDPLDIGEVEAGRESVSAGARLSDPELLTEWANWRADTMKTLVKHISDQLRAGNPRAQAAVVGQPQWYQQGLYERNSSLGDWLSWLTVGAAKEVMFTVKPEDVGSRDTLDSARGLSEKVNERVSVSLLIPDRGEKQPFDAALVREARKQFTANLYVTRLYRASDLAAVIRSWNTVQNPK